MSSIKTAPDIVTEQLATSLAIDLVGIQNVKLPIRLNSQTQTSSQVDLLVSLSDKHTRGIHMSRLYTVLHKYFSKNILSFAGLKLVLKQAIKGQKGLAQSGRIKVTSQWPYLKKALKSSLQGWREYPGYFEVNYSKKRDLWTYIFGLEILYSSTCPCSASLSRQIIKEHFKKTFLKKNTFTKQQITDWLSKESFLAATAHAQKSKAFVKLRLSENSKNLFSVLKTVDSLESQLGTAVQTAVKREDEAEFARLNATNLMFCEDAVRKLALVFKNKKSILDYHIRVQHYESLHPFTVESSITKGVKQGWTS